MATQNNAQGSLLEVLKKKMRAMKDDLETTREEADENLHKYQTEVRRREEVSSIFLPGFHLKIPSSFSLLPAYDDHY